MSDEAKLPEAKLLRTPLVSRATARVRHALRRFGDGARYVVLHPALAMTVLFAATASAAIAVFIAMRPEPYAAPRPACVPVASRTVGGIVSAAYMGGDRWVFVLKSDDGRETLELPRLFMGALNADAPDDRPVSLELWPAQRGCRDCCYIGTLHFHSTPQGRDLDAISRARLFE